MAEDRDLLLRRVKQAQKPPTWALLRAPEVVTTVGMRTKKEEVTARSSAAPAIAMATVRPRQAGARTRSAAVFCLTVRVAASRAPGKLGTELPRTQTAFASEAPDCPKCHLTSSVASPNPRRGHPLSSELLTPPSQRPVSSRLQMSHLPEYLSWREPQASAVSDPFPVFHGVRRKPARPVLLCLVPGGPRSENPS